MQIRKDFWLVRRPDSDPIALALFRVGRTPAQPLLVTDRLVQDVPSSFRRVRPPVEGSVIISYRSKAPGPQRGFQTASHTVTAQSIC